MVKIRRSRQRDAIMTYLKSRTDHPSAEQIYESVKQTMPNISLGTVYRNLNLLTQLGEISKISMPGSEPDRFDHITEENHHHAFCRCCKRLFDYELDEELHYEGHVIDKDFTVEKSQLILTGICKDCLEKNKE